jgi:hypothetical protein
MLKKILIIAVIIGVPLGIYIASRYGELTPVSFAEARKTVAVSESDQAPKVLIISTIVDATRAPSELLCTDPSGVPFRVQYTGSTPDEPFTSGRVVRFVGHVHDGGEPYFHASQVYGQ